MADVDFSSALYLGMRHPALSLSGWRALTLGKPAALEEAPAAAALAAQLAELQGCEAAVLLPSTLHLFWDVFGMAGKSDVLLLDGGSYPIARWGAQNGVARGMAVEVFAHCDVAAARRAARRWRRAGRRALLLADGYCPGGAAPPLAAYAAIADEFGGLLVVDDTQGLGVLGESGGGAAQALGGKALIGASLAKGFGAPLAVLSGSRALVAEFSARSQARRHCSPPSAAAVAAGLRALRLNRRVGDVLRARLTQRIAQFRLGVRDLGMSCQGGGFPVQTLCLPADVCARTLHAALARQGVSAVLQGARTGPLLSFLLRADHSAQDVAAALAAIRRFLGEHHAGII